MPMFTGFDSPNGFFKKDKKTGIEDFRKRKYARLKSPLVIALFF